MPATMSWPEAVGQIAGQRAKAETCVALIKRYGDDAQIARGQLTYADAKADFDAVIAGLITALSAGQTPASLPSLQAKLSSGVSGLDEFSKMVSDLLPRTTGTKGVMDELKKIVPIEPILWRAVSIPVLPKRAARGMKGPRGYPRLPREAAAQRSRPEPVRGRHAVDQLIRLTTNRIYSSAGTPRIRRLRSRSRACGEWPRL